MQSLYTISLYILVAALIVYVAVYEIQKDTYRVLRQAASRASLVLKTCQSPQSMLIFSAY
jgi:hypothetical protein